MVPKRILPLIVIAQFAGTSLWFASNAVIQDLHTYLHLGDYSLGNILTAVQFGFITGTLVFAVLSLADRFSPVMLFFLCCLAGGAFNLSVIWFATNGTSLFILRFITGFFLAGIYPVGMKIAADWHEKGLGNALGWLVGALVIGTALPHLLKGNTFHLPWENVFLITSILAICGGLIVYLFVPDGPFRKKQSRFDAKAIGKLFRIPDLRSAAFGYFGHMWELYTFWAFVPVLLHTYYAGSNDMPLLAFIIIAAGGVGCIAGGKIALRKGSANVAYYSLLISFLCCCIAFFILRMPIYVSLPFLVIWGISVVADSPQFSTLVARSAPDDLKGTALTIVTSIGFAITIVSIQLFNYLFVEGINRLVLFLLLSLGPLIGLFFLKRLVKKIDD